MWCLHFLHGDKKTSTIFSEGFSFHCPFLCEAVFSSGVFFFFLVQLFVFTDGLKIMRDDSWFQLTFIHIDATID